MTSDEFIEIVKQMQEGDGPLSPYPAHEIANAINTLIATAVANERKSCAIIAESAAEAAGPYDRGQTFEADPQKKAVCLEISQRIRNRK